VQIRAETLLRLGAVSLMLVSPSRHRLRFGDGAAQQLYTRLNALVAMFSTAAWPAGKPPILRA
jgi:hypothetical protein